MKPTGITQVVPGPGGSPQGISMPWKRTELRQYKGEGRLAMQRGSLEVVSLIPQAASPHSMEWEVRSRDLAKGRKFATATTGGRENRNQGHRGLPGPLTRPARQQHGKLQPAFLSPGTSDIWGWSFLAVGQPVHRRSVSSILASAH